MLYSYIFKTETHVIFFFNTATIAKAPLNPSSSHQEKSAKSHIS